MSETVSVDESLVQGLPLPLVRLIRRAQNAKTPLDRHQHAYYLWEAALKLLGSVAVVEYARLGHHDPPLVEMLENLARPAVGHWWQFVRRLVPVLADAGDHGLVPVRDLVLGRSREDLPRAAGLDAALLEHQQGKASARATVRLTELFDRLVWYRNSEIGHGAAGQRPAGSMPKSPRATVRVGVPPRPRPSIVGPGVATHTPGMASPSPYDYGEPTSLVFSPDGGWLFCCDSSATSRIDARTRQTRQDLMKVAEGRPR